MRARVIALGYHDVIDTSEDESGFTGPGPARYKLDWTAFGRHLEQIDSAMNRPPTRAPELVAGVPPGSWLLTFDDGGASSVRVAEMLAERGWPAHFFITTDRIGEPGFVSTADLHRLRELGHEVGSHSCSHPERMSRATRRELDHEWRDSLAVLSEVLGEPVTTASVPGGYFSAEVARAAADAGVEVLFTSEPDTTPRRVATCLVVGRMWVTASTTPERAAALASGRRPVVARAWASWNAKKLLKIAGGPAYLRLRRMVLSRRS